MFGTKCPSITSRWIQSAPAASTARTSSPSFEKSDARIDGAMTRGRETNDWDMGAYRCSPAGEEWPPRNMRHDRGQCGQAQLLWAEKSAGSGIYCRGLRVRAEAKSPIK